MDNNKNTEQITFEECVNAIIDSGTCEEKPHIVEAEDVFRQNELDKTLIYTTNANHYRFVYTSMSDTISISDLAYSFDPKNPRLFNLTPGVVDDDAPFFTIRKNDFRQHKPASFEALLLFTLRHQSKKTLQNELTINDNGEKKEINKI